MEELRETAMYSLGFGEENEETEHHEETMNTMNTYVLLVEIDFSF